VIVVDAAAVVDLLLQVEDLGDWVAARVVDEDLHAPHLLDYEVVSAVRRAHLHTDITASRARAACEYLADLRVMRYSAAPFIGRVWSLRRILSAYDASYVALAEALDAPLVTTDTRLARSHGHQATIEIKPS
jgi:predicted nucleic acid-binding protein